MKKRLWWLAAGVGLLVIGLGGTWFLLSYKTSQPNSAKKVATAESSTVEGQRTSPVLGKTIPGLPEYCADKLISVSGCDGMTEITTEQGNTYRLVEIGDQCWFADNLKEIPSTDQGWYGFYEDAGEEPAPGEGMLYTWDAAMNGETEERAQGVCPEGWHIPSDCEWRKHLKSVGLDVSLLSEPQISTVQVSDNSVEFPPSIIFNAGEFTQKSSSLLSVIHTSTQKTDDTHSLSATYSKEESRIAILSTVKTSAFAAVCIRSD